MAKEEDIQTVEEKEAKFNMALDTLKRLGEILREIKLISTNPDYSEGTLQNIKIIMTKQFFIQATPLLDSDIVKKYKRTVLGLRPSISKVMTREAFPELKGYRYVRNPQLEIILDTLLIDLESELQKKGHFMPPTDESSMF